MFLLLLLSIAITSCGGDEKDEPSSDPEGTHIDNVMNDCYITVGPYDIDCYQHEFTIYGLWNDISIVGPVKGLGDIKKKPDEITSWSYCAAIILHYGYVLRGGYYMYVDSELVDTNGGVIGYRIKWCEIK